MNIHELQEGSKEWDDQKEVVEELLEEEMLVSSSNHWLMVIWRKLVIGKRSSSCLEEVGMSIVGKSLIRSENDTLTFDGAVQINTFNLKKLTDIVGSKKI
nr:hypothetical protein [Tanacetum cinerariifolium]